MLSWPKLPVMRWTCRSTARPFKHANLGESFIMDFEYSAEQLHLRKSIRDFASAEIAPHVLDWDENQIFPLEVIKKAGELGLMGAIFPEELGGAGFGYIEYSIIIEELARVDPSVALIVAAHNSLC